MTRKRHDCDSEATEAARLEDPRSYITHDGHQFLFGADVRNRRQEVYDRDQGKCQGCRKPVGWSYFHMHHRQGGLVGRCTCMHNLEVLCPACHGKEHVRILGGIV
jgi:5-methylcytosine-specific restriction endonuclease McrA